MAIDRVTLQILANHCAAATESMAHTLFRTAHSTFVKETEDFTTGLATPAGKTFASPYDLGATWFVGLDYGRAIEILKGKGSEIGWGDDLGATDETLISEDHDRPVFIMNYPKAAKAFYMKENPDDPRTVLCDDLLAPEGYGEIIGGSQREDDLDKLLARIREEGLPEDAYAWYLDLRRYGTFPHSGFGLGIERTVAWITGRKHVRELIPFPRLMNRLYP